MEATEGARILSGAPVQRFSGALARRWGPKAIACPAAASQSLPLILCLHGFRTSGSIFRKQISKWDNPSFFAHFDMDFPDGMFPAEGKSGVEGIFPPPYFEWFQFNRQDLTVRANLEECIADLCDYITTRGPFDGLLGFSQGAALASLLLGYQAQGKILKEHPAMKVFISMSGVMFRDAEICEVAYKDPINVKSVHFIGDRDWAKLLSEELATAFVDPLIIRHSQGHTPVPSLDQNGAQKLGNWTRECALLHSNRNAAASDEDTKTMKNEYSKPKPKQILGKL